MIWGLRALDNSLELMTLRRRAAATESEVHKGTSWTLPTRNIIQALSSAGEYDIVCTRTRK